MAADMTLFQAAVLGAVQGLTEFLPVSSSGHLILVPALLGWKDASSLAFDAAVNVGTVAAVLVALREDAGKMVRGLARPKTDRFGRLGWMIIVATIPAVLAALFFRDALELYARTPQVVAGSLAVWGVLLLIADAWKGKSNKGSLPSMEGRGWGGEWKKVMLIGFAQAIALIPGTSRSGVTITAGLFAGLDRAAAARFSFLLGLPILLLASASGVYDVVKGGADVSVAVMSVGILTAFVAGLFAIRWLLKLFQGETTYKWFAVYRIGLAALVLVFLG